MVFFFLSLPQSGTEGPAKPPPSVLESQLPSVFHSILVSLVSRGVAALFALLPAPWSFLSHPHVNLFSQACSVELP